MYSPLGACQARLAAPHSPGHHKCLYVRILAGEIDFGFLPTSGLPPGLAAGDQRFQDELIVVGAGNHPLRNRRVVSPSELAGEYFVTNFRATVVRRMVAELMGEAASPVKISFEVDRSEMIPDLVASGAGIGIVPKRVAAEGIQKGTLAIISLAGFPRVIPYGFVFPAAGLSPAAESLVSHLSSSLEDGLRY